MPTDEENAWESAAAALDNGRGWPPDEFHPDNENDMRVLCDALKVDGMGAQLRLRRYIRNLLQQRQRKPGRAYAVTVIVKGGKQSSGARGNVYKLLERHAGHYSEKEGIDIAYEQENLRVKAYFVSYDSACHFQNAINEWETHKELVNLGGVTLDPLTPVEIDSPFDLQRIFLQSYQPLQFESSCQSLDQLQSYRLSIPETEPVEAGTDFARYQSIDKLVPHVLHYKCHLKDKARFKQLQSNENNMVAASWLFHQQLDGLNVEEGIPLVAISVKEASDCRSETHANRYPVTLSLRFFLPDLADLYTAPEFSNRINNDTWETTVYVHDKTTFCECVGWKLQKTEKEWREHRAFLQQD